MIKIKFPALCCFLLIDLCLLSGCATTPSQQTTTVHACKSVKNAPATKQKNSLSSGPVQIIQRPDRLRVVIYSDICFHSNGQLSAVCSKPLVNAMKIMKKYGDGMIQVVGYTDDIYDPTTAKKLSQREADTVVAFLWSHGISSRRLHAIGGGDLNPNASNRSVRGSAANRRVELILVK